ncbi:MAG TPA: glycosyltransferase family 4 protein [Rhizomicrobium sp.]|nr:glycosyltransferase family 4 protein [Rhizomicrobium sp.]
MTVGFGSAPYAQMLPEALSRHADVTLIAPDHFKDPVAGSAVVHFRTGISPKHTLRQSLKPWSHTDLLRKLHATRPDVIHILNGYGYPWALAIVAFAPAPVITTLHDPSPHPGNRVDAIQAVLGRFTLHRSAGIHIHDSIFLPDVQRRFSRKPIFVIRHPSFASRYLRHAVPGIARGRTVLFFGRVEHYKGIEVLLRAAQLLPPDIAVTVAGAGALSEREQQLAAALGPRLTLLNRFIEDDEAARLLQQAGVLALPYLQATQSSLPLIATAFCLPTVASAVGNFPDEVPPLGGIVVPFGDPQALATALRRQIDAPLPIHNKQETFEDLVPRFMDMYRKVVA